MGFINLIRYSIKLVLFERQLLYNCYGDISVPIFYLGDEKMRSKEQLAASIGNTIRKAEDVVSTMEVQIRILKHELACLHNDCAEGSDLLGIQEDPGAVVYSGTPKDKPPVD